MGTSITEGTIIGWLREVGDRVAADEPICQISTDKVDSECPSPAAGVLAEILVSEGETVEVGAILARIAVDAPLPLPAATQPPEDPQATDRGPTPPTAHRMEPSPRRRFSPVVRRIAAAHNVDLDRVEGTGRGGRVTKRDVMAMLELESARAEDRPLHSDSPYRPRTTATPPIAAELHDLGGRTEKLSRMRLAIGGAMLRSQAQAATAHTVVECDMTKVELERARQGLTALPLVAAACVAALRDFPELNARLNDETITRYEQVHLGIAVSLGDDGLIVPVIRNAQNLTPAGLASNIKDLASRARSKALKSGEVEGATFTITSPGAAGALIATPIIHVPEVAILDLEAIARRPVVITADDGTESIAIRSMAHLVLGWDHRAIDGMYAAHFLTALRRRLETHPS